MMISQPDAVEKKNPFCALEFPVAGAETRICQQAECLQFPQAPVAVVTSERMPESQRNPYSRVLSTDEELSDPIADEEKRFADAIEAAELRGRDAAREQSALEAEDRLNQERRKIIQTCEDFMKVRMEYFDHIDAEVIKLVLATAKRILHREVTEDALAIRDTVEKALRELADVSGIVMRVPEPNLEAWRTHLERLHSINVEIRVDSSLSAGDCVLETPVGRIDLGIEAQFSEIEMAFRAVAQERPAA